jgi:hypothetical protein
MTASVVKLPFCLNNHLNLNSYMYFCNYYPHGVGAFVALFSAAIEVIVLKDRTFLVGAHVENLRLFILLRLAI